MSSTLKHIIHKQILQVNCDNTKLASEYRDNISSMYYTKLLPIIDEVFSELVPDDSYLFLDKLELDLGNIPVSGFESEMISRLRKTLNSAIQKQTTTEHQIIFRTTNTEIIKEGTQPVKENEKLSKKEALNKAFFGFLIKGVLPVWYTGSNIKSFENELTFYNCITESDLDRIIELSKQYPYIPKRILLQFSSSFFEYLFQQKKILQNVYISSGLQMFYKTLEKEKKAPESKLDEWWIIVFREMLIQMIFESFNDLTSAKIVKFIREYIQKLPVQTRMSIEYIIKLVFQEIKQGNLNQYLLLSEAITYLQKTDFDPNFQVPDNTFTSNKLTTDNNDITENNDVTEKSLILSKTDTSDSQQIIEDINIQADGIQQYVKTFFTTQIDEQGEYFYVKNAGIVILIPYIQMFFKALGLLEQNRFLSELAIYKGVFLFHYLGYKINTAEENDQILNKILCGIPVEQPAPAEIEFTDTELTEAENMLTAVIRNWPVLKNTSPDGLREAFLQREGKLTLSENGWKLNIEHKSIDVLLSSLPWSYSVIKLPWMNNFILVEWN